MVSLFELQHVVDNFLLPTKDIGGRSLEDCSRLIATVHSDQLDFSCQNPYFKLNYI